MAIETDRERGVFLADFGIAAIYTHANDPVVSITVIFDKEYVGVDANGQVVVESSHPKALAKTSAVAGAAHGDTLFINSVLYRVVGVHPDGQGMTELILEVS